MSFGAKLIIDELAARPGQSKYLLASHMHLPPVELESELDKLVDDGTVVPSTAKGASEPVFWVNEQALTSGA